MLSNKKVSFHVFSPRRDGDEMKATWVKANTLEKLVKRNDGMKEKSVEFAIEEL